MTSYLNYADKEVIVSLAGCVGFADTLLEGKRFRNSDAVMSDLEKMRKYAQKCVDTIIKGVDPDQKEGCLRFANNCELTVNPKHAKINTYAIVDPNDLKLIISNVVSSCSFCDLEGKKAKKCELRKALLRCGMVSGEDSVMKDINQDCPFKR